MRTRYGVTTAVVLSMADDHRLTKRPSLVDYLLSGPILDDAAIALINEWAGAEAEQEDFSY